MHKSRNNDGLLRDSYSVWARNCFDVQNKYIENMNFDVENMSFFPSHIHLGVLSLLNHSNFVSVQNKYIESMNFDVENMSFFPSHINLGVLT